MQRFLAIRLLQSLAALFFISLIAFSLASLSGSPVDSLLPEDATAEHAALMIERWGLDRPLYVQYLTFVGNALQGDFGESLKWRGYTAIGIVMDRFPATLQLGLFAIVVSVVIAVPLGVLTAVRRDTAFDSAGNVVALLGQSLPPFWIGLVLIWVFAVYLGWLPTSGYGGLSHMIMPAVAIGWFQVAAVMRLTRSSMLEVLDSEYIKLARVKGVPEWKIIWKHALRNAAIVPLTYFGVIASSILTGQVVVETVFAWPGTGMLAIEAIQGRDFPVVRTIVLFFATIFIVANFLVDVLYAYLDPRIAH